MIELGDPDDPTTDERKQPSGPKRPASQWIRRAFSPRNIKRTIAGLATIPAVLGVLQTLVGAGTGEASSASDAAYYAGVAAFGLVAAGFTGALAAAGLLKIVEGVVWVRRRLGAEMPEPDLDRLFLVLVPLFALAYLVVYFAEPPDPEGGAATAFRALGIVTVFGGALAFIVNVADREKVDRGEALEAEEIDEGVQRGEEQILREILTELRAIRERLDRPTERTQSRPPPSGGA